MRALWTLDTKNGRPIGDLAREWDCDPSNATFIVGRLENAGLAQREALEVDRRVKLVFLTSSGAATRDELQRENALFDSFNKCSDPVELKKHAAFFAKDVEFFHDLGGVTLGLDPLIANTQKNVCGQFRRELDRGSFRVFPIPGYGAMALGTHRFCHTPASYEGIGEFLTVWREKNGMWQITRALSYAHRSL